MKLAKFLIQDIETKEYFFEFHENISWTDLCDSYKYESEEEAVKAIIKYFCEEEFEGRVVEVKKFYGL